MPSRRRCDKSISVILTKIKQASAGGPIPRFSTPESRLYLACAQAAGIASIDLPDEIGRLLEKLGDNMDKAREANELSDTEAERMHVSTGVELYRQTLGRLDELGLQEPQTLTVTFNNLVRRHYELKPNQSEGRQR